MPFVESSTKEFGNLLNDSSNRPSTDNSTSLNFTAGDFSFFKPYVFGQFKPSEIQRTDISVDSASSYTTVKNDVSGITDIDIICSALDMSYVDYPGCDPNDPSFLPLWGASDDYINPTDNCRSTCNETDTDTECEKKCSDNCFAKCGFNGMDERENYTKFFASSDASQNCVSMCIIGVKYKDIYNTPPDGTTVPTKRQNTLQQDGIIKAEQLQKQCFRSHYCANSLMSKSLQTMNSSRSGHKKRFQDLEDTLFREMLNVFNLSIAIIVFFIIIISKLVYTPPSTPQNPK